jgi:hypothetical protein
MCLISQKHRPAPAHRAAPEQVSSPSGYADDIDDPSDPYYFTDATLKVDMREQRREMRMRFGSNIANGNYYMGKVILSLDTGDVRSTGNP